MYTLGIVRLCQEGSEGNLICTKLIFHFSRADEGFGAIFGDVILLSAGYALVILFVMLVLGRFSLIEHKVSRIKSFEILKLLKSRRNSQTQMTINITSPLKKDLYWVIDRRQLKYRKAVSGWWISNQRRPLIMGNSYFKNSDEVYVKVYI